MVQKHYRVVIDIDVRMDEPSLERVRKRNEESDAARLAANPLYPWSETDLPTEAQIQGLKELHAEIERTPEVLNRLLRDEVVMELGDLDLEPALELEEGFGPLIERLSPAARYWLRESSARGNLIEDVDALFAAIETTIVSLQIADISEAH